ncbi:MAG: lipopolysaccharide biosynthesis protein [Anaerolineae bacterium]
MVKPLESYTEPGAFLDTSHLDAALSTHTARGGAIAVSTQLLRQLINVGATALMARLLLPSDYGLVAMVTAVTGFLAIIKEMGLSLAVVQRQHITQEQVSTLFWVNVVAGLLLTALVGALAPLVGWFYREQRLVWLTVAVGLDFAIAGLAVQHRALLKRQMRFGALAKVDLLALCVQVGAGIGLALAGWGYWALVGGTLAGSLAVTALLWAVCLWRPVLPQKGSGVRSLLAFGSHLVGFDSVNYFARNLDNVLIGRVWGDEQLGLYAKAYSLLLLPIATINAPVAAVIVPALSRLQDKPDEHSRLYLQVVAALAFVTMPIAMLMIVTAEDLIWVVLGPRWAEASTIFRYLGLSALVQPIYHTQSWVHTSLGRSKRLLRWGLIGSAAIVTSFLVGLPFGARGVALAYAVAILVITWPCLWYAFRNTRITMAKLLAAVSLPLAASVLAAGIGLSLVAALTPWWPPLRLAAVAIAMALAYLGVIGVLPAGRQRIRELRHWATLLK